jgi:hypothetical protein
MQFLDGLRDLLTEAADLGARKALEKAAASPRRLLPLRECGVSYRLVLAAERAGELRVYRRGHASFVELAELERWILASPVARAAEPEGPASDEIDEIIRLTDERRKVAAGRGHGRATAAKRAS